MFKQDDAGHCRKNSGCINACMFAQRRTWRLLWTRGRHDIHGPAQRSSSLQGVQTEGPLTSAEAML